MEQQKQENKRGHTLFFLLFFFILSLAITILGVFCLNELHDNFLQGNILLKIVIFGTCAVVLFLLGLFVTFGWREGFSKGLLGLYVFILFALSSCFILQRTGFFEMIDTPEKLQEYLEKLGVWMPIFYIVLQFLQVVILPIPSIVSTVAGVALFGAFRTMIYSLAGILIGSITAFFIGRRLGNKAVSWIIGNEMLSKWQKKLKGKDTIVLSLMFVLPLFPDDVLCFIAGLSTMSTRYFLVVVLLTRLLGIFATCYSVNFIPFTTWWGIILWLVFAVVVIAVGIILYRKMDSIQHLLKRRSKKCKKNK